MNIKEAKEHIKNAMKAYFTKDEYGEYVIPIEAQRPVFMLGAPGIGKTAIMEQIASELDVPLVSYTMTHHTRQSAIGLPYIADKTFDGKEFKVSEYTMSEIIASVFETIEATGKKEGILFLDEINCVSETLAPAMLQFLQYKIFGGHRVPDGWIVVTAGNPQEFNKSVREFDVATWDRIKRIDVEPDFEIWKEYAYKTGVHPAVISYLNDHKESFYSIESTPDGKRFVTARGWCDLSKMIKLYEEHSIVVDANLVGQYVHNKVIAQNFVIYYELFNRYKRQYRIADILEGESNERFTVMVKNAQKAERSERFSLIGVLLDGLSSRASDVIHSRTVLKNFKDDIILVRTLLGAEFRTPTACFSEVIRMRQERMDIEKKAGMLSAEKREISNRVIALLKKTLNAVYDANIADMREAMRLAKKEYDELAKAQERFGLDVKEKFENAFKFMEGAFGDEYEMTAFVAEITRNSYTSSFISAYNCEEYYKHNSELLLSERQDTILRDIENLDIDD